MITGIHELTLDEIELVSGGANPISKAASWFRLGAELVNEVGEAIGGLLATGKCHQTYGNNPYCGQL